MRGLIAPAIRSPVAAPSQRKYANENLVTALIRAATSPLLNGVTLSRASGGATYDDFNQLTVAGTNAPRRGAWRTDAQGKYVGYESGPAQGVNMLSNPGHIGVTAGVIGSGGTLPTGWTMNTLAGLTMTILGTDTRGGVPGFTARFQGTATANNFRYLVGTGLPLDMGANYVASAHAEVIEVVGTRPLTFEFRLVAPDEQGQGITNNSFVRVVRSKAVTTSTGRPELRVGLTIGTTYDFTFWIGGVQLEKAAAVSPLILPPTGQLGPVARYAHNGGLVIEGQRTNSIRNPWAVGASAPSTLPTYWNTNTVAGVTMSVVARGTTTNGLPYLDIRFAGTASAAGDIAILPDSNGGIVAANAQTWTLSCYAALVSGSLTGLTNPRLVLDEYNGTGSWLTFGEAAVAAPTGNLTRVSYTRTLSGGATVARIEPFYRLSVANGAVVDATFRIAAPQIEQGSFASSPILPPTDTIAASSRAADAPIFALTPAQASRGTIVGTFMLPQATATSTAQGLFTLDNGTLNERIVIRNVQGGGLVTGIKVIGGTGTAIGNLGNLTPGTPFRVALSWDASGTTVCMNGGTPVSVAGPIPTINRLLVGHNQSDLSAAAFGEVISLDIYSARLPDAQLRLLTA